MFRHKGRGRNYIHNLKLAAILSCVAGVVNITGVISMGLLTTNVTGHFAYFSEELASEHYGKAIAFLLYILFFLLGAFLSSFSMEWLAKHKTINTYILPISIEILLLLMVGFSQELQLASSTYLSLLLLFSMGLQNALVTRVSQSVVRTTHLTGIFTDLGIELSQLFFYTNKAQTAKLRKSINLKLAIIGFFFAGCVAGVYLFRHFKIKTLLLSVALLVFALWYDRLLFRFYSLKRKLKYHH
jgi:uncharacterized membrane protein YoaK (UPF0700 family)